MLLRANPWAKPPSGSRRLLRKAAARFALGSVRRTILVALVTLVSQICSCPRLLSLPLGAQDQHAPA
jgi:hypothetical protein